MVSKAVDSVLRPLSECPMQAYLSNQLQVADVVEWCLAQMQGEATIRQTSFSISEEFIRRLYHLRRSGKVTDINYQTTQIETISGTLVAFLNANLFGKSFQNLTRNNEYEFTKVTVGVAYGVDIEKVRTVLTEALEVLKTKDKYGRAIVEPKFGINIRFGDFGDSAVEIAVKQFVLVPERGLFIDREKEIIYKALNDAGITIPFPQCDVHLIKDE